MTVKRQASTINILAMLPANVQLTDGANGQTTSLWKTQGAMTTISRAAGRSLCLNSLLMCSSHSDQHNTRVLTGATLLVIWRELEADCEEAVCVTQSYSDVKTMTIHMNGHMETEKEILAGDSSSYFLVSLSPHPPLPFSSLFHCLNRFTKACLRMYLDSLFQISAANKPNVITQWM